MTNGWIVIIYKVPSTPSTSRVTVWKRLKELGAQVLQQSVYILPNLPEIKEAINQLKEQIFIFKGECKLLNIESLGEEQEKEVIAGFKKSREEEYGEVIEACEELSTEIDNESEAGEFHYEDLEENDKHLQRVRELFDNVASRDFFGSPFKIKAQELLKECDDKYEEFSQAVFSHEGILSEEREKPVLTGTKYKNKQAYSKNELISKGREIFNNLKNGTLEIQGKIVMEISESALLEWEYKERKTGNSLEIKVEWATAHTNDTRI